MRVCLVATVRNEAATLPEWIDSVSAQTRQPDEVIVVDGGSTDGSWELLEKWAADVPLVRLILRAGANISEGRNTAIAAATCEAIAVTDAGCTLDEAWLEHLAGTLEAGADVAMGFYEPDARSELQRLIGCLNLPDAWEIDPLRFMPSSRSVAFRRTVWEQAGGYPEWLPVGEDMYFDFAVLQAGASRVFVPQAIVRWRLRSTLEATARQYYRYGEGDGIAGMYPGRHALRFATYAAAAGALAALGARRFLPVALLAVVVRMRPAYRRALRRLRPEQLPVALVALPALETLLDLSKMAGYLPGLGKRSRVSARTGDPKQP